MNRIVLLLSGPIGVGKTTVSDALVEAGFSKIRSGKYLESRAQASGRSCDRTSLQQLGDELDAETDYRWLIDAVAVPTIEAAKGSHLWLVDAVRKRRQVEHFRSRFGASVRHLHLIAPESVLKERYDARIAAGGEYAGNTSYDIAARHPNEVAARALVEIADVVCDMTELAAADIVKLAAL